MTALDTPRGSVTPERKSNAAIARDQMKGRQEKLLHTCCGPEIIKALSDDDVVEIMANPDGSVWIDTHRDGQKFYTTIEPAAAENVIKTVASMMSETVDTKHVAEIGGVLPGGERFQGLLPPLVAQGSFTIRKRSVRIFSLADYVKAGTLSQEQHDILRAAIAARKNLLVVGGTGTGKTTLCNALLADDGFKDHRVVIIEDTKELQCSAENKAELLTSREAPTTNMTDLLRSTMRLRPDRIVVGEVRGGEALDLIKAWNTGHPGGLGTLHADNAMQGLKRLESLIGEVAANVDREAIGEAIGYVIAIRRTDQGRSVDQIIEVERYDPLKKEYVIKDVGEASVIPAVQESADASTDPEDTAGESGSPATNVWYTGKRIDESSTRHTQ